MIATCFVLFGPITDLGVWRMLLLSGAEKPRYTKSLLFIFTGHPFLTKRPSIFSFGVNNDVF